MKVAALIVALGLALASGAPAQTAPLAGATGAVSSVAQRATLVTNTTAGTTAVGQDNDDDAAFAAPGPSTYLLLALGLLGMGLVSRRRRAD